MALNHNPKIVTDGLVFAYDMSNSQKSWRGAPTTNLITNPTSEVIATASEFAIFQDLSPIFDTQGPGIYSISADIKTPKPGAITVYTASGSVEYDIGYYTADCETYYKRFYFNNINVARTDPTSSISNLSFYGGYGSGLFPSIKNVQLEKNNFSTPFVIGTRSNTQAILDLTNKSTITASSLTYNANGTFSFNGSGDTMDCGNPAILSAIAGTSAVSVEAWVNLSGYGSSSYGVITHKGYPWTWLMENPGNRMQIRFYLSNSGDVYCSDSATHALNTWYHFVGTYDGSFMRFYRNGVLTNSVAGSGTVNGAGSSHVIGSYSGAYFSQGQIPIVKVYNRTLSDMEIQQNFNALRGRYGI